MWYVSEYEVTRHYGGPEEGGWWYSWYEHKSVIDEEGAEKDAVAKCLELAEEYAERLPKGWRDQGSVMPDGPDVVFMPEQTIGEWETKEAPHYE